MTADPTLIQWVALSLLPNVGGRTLAMLLDHFGDLDAIFSASESDLRAVRGIGPKLSAAIRSIDLDHTAAEMAAWQSAGIEVLLQPAFHTLSSAPRTANGLYPAALAALPDAPPVLFGRGTLIPGDTRSVAIVGTRSPPAAARRFAASMAQAFAQRGWTIVSGLAAGIDTAAHEGALHAGGRTLAILGSGVNVVYPPQNAALAAAIRGHGGLFAEVHPEATPTSPALVARNRIISGLSRAIIVVEASETSGSLHAARFARHQNRPVYAVANDRPGNRQLIADGARPLPPDFVAWDDLATEIAGEH
jgi:DNA processing protein